MSPASPIDRLSIRQRPPGLPLMYQSWGKLLFMHWRIAEKDLRPIIPAEISIDTFDGSAWIGIVPFTMWGIRACFLPAIPGTSAFHELNVRTYVHYEGVPGVWFFSLDAANALAVWGARTFYYLPYFNARMDLEQSDNQIVYDSTRVDGRGAPASFHGTWEIGETLPRSELGSIEFFLTERYCLYAARRDRIYRSRISHPPWPLQDVKLVSHKSTMVAALGLPEPDDEPLLHYAESIAVDIWPLQRV